MKDDAEDIVMRSKYNEGCERWLPIPDRFNQMHCRLVHAIIADPHGHDRVPCRLGRFLLGECQHHFQWYCAAEGVKRHHLLILIGAAILDDALESLRLQLHPNHECPIGVTGLGVGRIATPTTYLTNHPVDHDSIEGVVVDLLPHHLHNKDRNLALDLLVRTRW
jgi:hypothetical protein